MSYKRITLNERMSIFQILYTQGMKPTEIADRLNR
jgi:IS30 family transposase